MLMNVSAAIAAGISGPLQTAWGFGGLNVVAAALTLPVLLLLVGLGRSRAPPTPTDGPHRPVRR